jgi:hypothetical protein
MAIRKNYKFYLKVAANQILTKRGKCLHVGDWQLEKVLYRRCIECGAFIPFRNPFETIDSGETGAADFDMEFPHSHISHIQIDPASLA